MNTYACYREPIDCPECGKATHELFHTIMEGEQPVMMCENCHTDELGGSQWLVTLKRKELYD